MTSNALMNPENAPRSEEELASEGVFVHRARVDALHGFRELYVPLFRASLVRQEYTLIFSRESVPEPVL